MIQQLTLDYEIQKFADRQYAHRRLTNFSGAAQNTAEDIAARWPKLTKEQVNDYVFEATVNFTINQQ